MGSESGYIISAEPYEKYDDQEENRRWEGWLEEQITNGRMRKGVLANRPAASF